jgi:anthranilate synthase component 2
VLLVIDNYDSFTWNLVHYLAELGAEPLVRRNDALGVREALALDPSAILLSPGPCDPDRAGICLPMVRAAAESRIPLLGVCLGHQAIGQAFSARVVRASRIVHGKVDRIEHDGTGVFSGLPSPLGVTRYHSLVVEDVPDCLMVTARAADGSVMGLAHRSLPIHGVQFHPESIASESGHALLRNFLDLLPVPA